MGTHSFSLKSFNFIVQPSDSNSVVYNQETFNNEFLPVMDAIKANISPFLTKNVYIHFYKSMEDNQLCVKVLVTDNESFNFYLYSDDIKLISSLSQNEMSSIRTSVQNITEHNENISNFLKLINPENQIDKNESTFGVCNDSYTMEETSLQEFIKPLLLMMYGIFCCIVLPFFCYKKWCSNEDQDSNFEKILVKIGITIAN